MADSLFGKPKLVCRWQSDQVLIKLYKYIFIESLPSIVPQLHKEKEIHYKAKVVLNVIGLDNKIRFTRYFATDKKAAKEFIENIKNRKVAMIIKGKNTVLSDYKMQIY